MLSRFRISRFTMLCWVTALGWVIAGTLDILGAVDIDDDLAVLCGAGLLTVVLLWCIGRQMGAHEVRQRRLDRQVGAAASILRRGFHEDGNSDRIPLALLDDRTLLPGAEVVELRRAGTPAHRRQRSH